MQHFTLGKNIGLTLCKQFKTGDNYVHAFIANKVIESSYVSNRTSEITSTFPLYIYPETSGRSEEHTSELQSRGHLVCRLLLEKKKNKTRPRSTLTTTTISAG